MPDARADESAEREAGAEDRQRDEREVEGAKMPPMSDTGSDYSRIAARARRRSLTHR